MSNSDIKRASVEEELIGIHKWEDERIIMFTFPTFNGGKRTFDQVLDFFRGEDEPWKWDTIFNHLGYKGHATFDELIEFSQNWYKIVGDKDVGRLVSTIADDPLTHNRYATESYQKLFPTRGFKLVGSLDEALDFIRANRTAR